jgi:hypothetical protein
MPLLATALLLGTGDLRSRQHAGRPECPHDWDLKHGGTPRLERTINVPEFNDCQRFVVVRPDSTVYDSLYAIFASDSLRQLDRELARADSTDPSAAIIAAYVYAEGTYAALGIRPGFNCLYLLHVDSPSGWQAAMLPTDRYEPGNCATASTAAALKVADARFLEARIDPNSAGAADSNYPPVARWDWDSVRSEQYVGIKCGAAWCEVGKAGFTASGTAWPTENAMTLPKGTTRWRTRVVKGWYDQQFLATLIGGKAYPSRIRGTIYPDPILDSRVTTAGFPPGRWTRVAEVALEVPDGVANPYRTSLSLDPTPRGGPARLNVMSLCRGSREQCWIRPDLNRYTAAERSRVTAWWLEVDKQLNHCAGEGAWWFRIQGARGSASLDTLPVARCAVRRGHELYGRGSLSIRIPGTSRWRWLASDETVWIECTQGCCETEMPCLGPSC